MPDIRIEAGEVIATSYELPEYGNSTVFLHVRHSCMCILVEDLDDSIAVLTQMRDTIAAERVVAENVAAENAARMRCAEFDALFRVAAE